MWSVSADWLWCYHGSQFLRGSFFQKIENPFLKWRKITFFPWLLFLAHISVFGFDYFSFNFGAFLEFWENPEIQDGGSKMVAIWQSWPNFHVIWRHRFEFQTPKEILLDVHCQSFYTCEVMEEGSALPPSPPPPAPTTEDKKQPGVDSVKSFHHYNLYSNLQYQFSHNWPILQLKANLTIIFEFLVLNLNGGKICMLRRWDFK